MTQQVNTPNDDTIMNDHDFVFTKDKTGQIQVGGYALSATSNPLLQMKQIHKTSNDTNVEQSPEGMDSDPEHIQSGGGIFNTMQNLIVPAGLFYLQQAASSKPVSNTFDAITSGLEHMGMMEESLYDKLVGLASFSTGIKHNKKTRKHGKKINKKSSGTNKKNRKTRRIK
jgi:hypothetical protein